MAREAPAEVVSNVEAIAAAHASGVELAAAEANAAAADDRVLKLEAIVAAMSEKEQRATAGAAAAVSASAQGSNFGENLSKIDEDEGLTAVGDNGSGEGPVIETGKVGLGMSH